MGVEPAHDVGEHLGTLRLMVGFAVEAFVDLDDEVRGACELSRTTALAAGGTSRSARPCRTNNGNVSPPSRAGIAVAVADTLVQRGAQYQPGSYRSPASLIGR